MSENICEVCKKSFKSKYNLKSHIEKNKKCLTLRGVEIESEFKCICGHLSMKNNDLINHQKKCIVHIRSSIRKECELEFTIKLEHKKKEFEHKKKDFEKKIQDLTNQLECCKKIEEYRENTISKLEDTIQKMADHPKVTTNTITHNNNINSHNSSQILDLDHHIISNFLKNELKPEDVAQGQIGFAKAVHKKLLISEDGTQKYKCTDPSRHIYEYVNKEGDVIKDVKSTKLTNALTSCPKFDEVILKKGEEIWTDKDGQIDNEKFSYFAEKPMEITLMSTDNTKFRNALSSITS
jgi:hypothetical protein